MFDLSFLNWLVFCWFCLKLYLIGLLVLTKSFVSVLGPGTNGKFV